MSGRTNTITAKDSTMDYSTKSVIYLISGTRCKVQYVGQTIQPFNARMTGHRSAIKNAHKRHSLLSKHFNGDYSCNPTHFSYKIIEGIIPTAHFTKEEKTRERKIRDTFWMKELRTVTPYGLNNSCDSTNWGSEYKDTDIVAKLFNPVSPLNGRCRGYRGRRKYKNTRVHFNFSRFLKTFLYLFEKGLNWRFWSKKVILSLGNKIVRKLIRKISDNFDCDNYPSILNKFIHDCVKYKVHRDIHLSKKQNRRYIKIQYLNKAMDEIHLNRIFLKTLKNINVELKYNENPTVIWHRTDKISSKVHNYIHITNDTKVMD